MRTTDTRGGGSDPRPPEPMMPVYMLQARGPEELLDPLPFELLPDNPTTEQVEAYINK